MFEDVITQLLHVIQWELGRSSVCDLIHSTTMQMTDSEPSLCSFALLLYYNRMNIGRNVCQI